MCVHVQLYNDAYKAGVKGSQGTSYNHLKLFKLQYSWWYFDDKHCIRICVLACK